MAQKAQSPYLVHELPGGAVQQLAFCPYEDVLVRCVVNLMCQRKCNSPHRIQCVKRRALIRWPSPFTGNWPRQWALQYAGAGRW